MDTSSNEHWRQARLSRDPRFDGVFFVGVVSTGIFCRPICSARLPREDNVRYMRSPAEAAENGFRPCKRCRPEYAPKAIGHLPDERLSQALEKIEQGFLDCHPLPQLAEKLDLSERQLRRLFVENLGAAPQKVADTRRLLQAKQLLRESNLSITDIAGASGFNSIRRFNSAIKAFYRQTPREIRSADSKPSDRCTDTVLQLPHSADYPWDNILKFYRTRAIEGFEVVDQHSFSPVLRINGNSVLLHCRQARNKRSLEVRFSQLGAADLAEAVTKARQVLDLNSNHLAIADHLKQDKLLLPAFATCEVIALPGAWDPFEYLIRAIIGQQVSVKGAKTLTRRLIEAVGQTRSFSGKHYWQFPTPEQLASASLDGLGLTQRRIDTIQAVARAQASGDLDLYHPSSLNELRQQLLEIKGIGPWTVSYLMLRAYSQSDEWLGTDLGVIKSLQRATSGLSPEQLQQQIEHWSPWRSYAVIALWQLMENL